MSAICTFLLPLGTCLNFRCEDKTNYIGLIYTLRVITGFVEGFSYPGVFILLKKWVPKEENTMITNICLSG